MMRCHPSIHPSIHPACSGQPVGQRPSAARKPVARCNGAACARSSRGCARQNARHAPRALTSP
eukprot:scaffold517_cov392-Prasinococcus_capsulatus_cf.AAC.10